jgi:hypothetical protein
VTPDAGDEKEKERWSAGAKASTAITARTPEEYCSLA